MKRRGTKRSRRREGNKKTHGEAEVIMDEKLWKDLPEELIEAVLARLPIPTLLRVRSVCKKWSSLPKSPHFRQLLTDFAPQKQPLFFAIACNGDVKIGALYDPSTSKWHHNNNQLPPCSTWRVYRIASAGGLVCFYEWARARFLVGNCLTQTWKDVPCSYWTGYRWGMDNVMLGMVTLNQHSSSYKIIWVDNFGNYGVFDPIKVASSTRRIPNNITLSGFKGRTVSIDTVVYFLTTNGIVSYDVETGAWEQFLVPAPYSYRGSLAECGGQILLVGVANSADFSVRVWELDKAMLRWKEVDRMPSSWCCVFGHDLTDLFCMGNRRVLVMSLSTTCFNWIVTYDVVNRKWSKAPQLTIRGLPRCINYGVSFFPCLSASP